MLALTIESSCDETSAAVIRDGREILSNAVASQIPVHRRFGGVVPELASRNHVIDVQSVIADALRDADVSLQDIEGFAVTQGPGLVGSLLVGIETAKTLAWSQNKPLVGLNHLEGHLTAVLLETGNDRPTFPYLGVIVSGGHTDIYVVRAVGEYSLLGRTRDDAAGEAFDKVAKMLGLPYPGGVEIDRLAKAGDPEAIDFPRPMWTRKHFDFSFSGLKTAVLYEIEKNHPNDADDPDQALADVCASFQQAVVDILVMKAIAAAKQEGIRDIVFSGGVACNTRLREVSVAACKADGLRALFCESSLCTDNAAMLGVIADHYLSEAGSTFDAFTMKATSNMPLGTSERKQSGFEDRHR